MQYVGAFCTATICGRWLGRGQAIFGCALQRWVGRFGSQTSVVGSASKIASVITLNSSNNGGVHRARYFLMVSNLARSCVREYNK